MVLPLLSFQPILLHQVYKLPRFRGPPPCSLLNPLTAGLPQSGESWTLVGYHSLVSFHLPKLILSPAALSWFILSVLVAPSF